MLKQWPRTLGLMAIAMLALGMQAQAANVVISSTSFDYQYVPNTTTPSQSALCDGKSCNGGDGTVANADPVSSMSFTLIGAPNQLLLLLTQNIYIDMYLQLGGFLQLGGSQTITGGIFDLFDKSTNPGWGLAINVTGGSVFVNSNGGLSITLVGSASGVQCGTCVPGNTFGFITGPFTISFSSVTNLTGGSGSGDPTSITTGFTANGSPDVTGTFIPEPMTMSLMGAGLVGLALLRRRIAK